MIRGTLGPTALAISLVLAACTQAPPPPQQNAAADLASIAAIRAAYATAMGAGDATAIADLYTEDGVSQTNLMATMSGRAAIAEGQKAAFAQFSFADMEITPEETQTLGSTGYERGRFKMTVTPKAGGAPMAQQGRYMLVLQKGDDGMWRVARDMDNVDSLPPAAAPAPAAPAQ